jgi:branched-subunit amino acid aminotransferase/4-amino-4-deoxychorismate lyase
VVLGLCRELGLPTREAAISAGRLAEVDGVFLSLSSVGIAEGVALDGQPLRQSPVTNRLRLAYLDLLCAEACAAT